MNFGDAWTNVMGECSKETAFEMMDFFYDQGGNFIDTYVQWQDPSACSGAVQLRRPADLTGTIS